MLRRLCLSLSVPPLRPLCRRTTSSATVTAVSAACRRLSTSEPSDSGSSGDTARPPNVARRPALAVVTTPTHDTNNTSTVSNSSNSSNTSDASNSSNTFILSNTSNTSNTTKTFDATDSVNSCNNSDNPSSSVSSSSSGASNTVDISTASAASDNDNASANSTPDSFTSVDFESENDVHDSAFIFEQVWSNLSAKYGEENLVFPRDIMWLSGAPGSGKGQLTEYVKKLRGITSDVIVTSQLLQGPEIERIKAEGRLVSNQVVIQLLFERLLEPAFASGVIVDGFPRTKIQGECMKMLYDMMMHLRSKFEPLEKANRFWRPVFHIMVLFVEEDESVARQLQRGIKVDAHNRRITYTGIGDPIDKRLTDSDPVLASQRYQQFKEHVYDSLQAVKKKFHFHFIDANGTIEEVQQRIERELQYQSDMELSNSAFEMVRRIPLPAAVTQNARHFLVQRIETYATEHRELFDKVIQVLEDEFIAILKRQALLGRCIIRTENVVFHQPMALDMALDLLAERGYSTVLDYQKMTIPDRIQGEQIIVRKQKVYEFHISFPRPLVRTSS